MYRIFLFLDCLFNFLMDWIEGLSVWQAISIIALLFVVGCYVGNIIAPGLPN